MSPRQRKPVNRALPPGMRIVRDGYYTWTHPETGVEYGLGRDRQRAITEVRETLAALGQKHLTLLERVSGGGTTWAQWCNTFESILAERESATNTRRTRKSQMVRLRRIFPPTTNAAAITTQDCAKVIDAVISEGKRRTAQAFRSFLMDSFDRMIAKGIRKDNPASVLDEVKVKVKRARLTLDILMQVYEKTDKRWLKNAIALALVSGQGREEVGFAEFADVTDDAWWCERGKTGARIILPLDLRLDRFPLSLGDVVRQCRMTGIVSKYLVHQTERAKGAQLGKKMHLAKLTREFTAVMRTLGIDWGGKQAATFHEIRSLSGRLYKEQGNVNPQELLGHKDPRTTAIYTDGRGEWVRVAVRKTTV